MWQTVPNDATDIKSLVRAYHRIQTHRLRIENQIRTGADIGILSEHVDHLRRTETTIKRHLGKLAGEVVPGRWAISIPGVGPVTAATLIAYIDITRAPTAAHIWRYAGLDPTAKWRPGEIRPWNPILKRTCWLLGENFVRQSKKPGDVYGKVYLRRKSYESARNERGEYAEQAEAILRTRKFSEGSEAFRWYSQGKLPPAHIHARAKRYAVKMFLSHYHYVSYVDHYGVDPPRPYGIQSTQGHVFHVPNWPLDGPSQLK